MSRSTDVSRRLGQMPAQLEIKSGGALKIAMHPGAEPVSRNEIETAIRAAVGYLSRHIGPSGRFDYVYDPRNRTVPRGYNLLRHAGTTMALYRLVGSRFDDGTAARIASLAWSYLRNFLVPITWDGHVCFCLADRGMAKLGGTALALLALAARQKGATSSQEDVRLVEALGTYLVCQQQSSGRFVSKVDLLARTEIPFESAYYPGQAVLALCAAYRVTQDVRFLECADRGIRYLAQGHLASAPTPTGFADHWAMIALAALHDVKPDRWYVEHLRYLVDPLTLPAERGKTNWQGGEFTTQIATRLEGLVAALEVELRLNERMHALCLLRTILTGLAHCYTRQVGGRGKLTISEDLRAHGGFIRSLAQPSIRIDYVQHALLASFGVIESLPPGRVRGITRRVEVKNGLERRRSG
jgi:hypothetical protein